jgi:transposase-like protein
VLWRVRYTLSLRDLPEMFLERGLVFTHEAVREWEAQLAPLLSAMLRKPRRGRIGPSWYTDETSIKVKGRWTYLYRAIDRAGNLVAVLLSEKRDKAAAEAFFRSARIVPDSVPNRVTTDGHDAYAGAIKAELGEAVRHRTNRYLNNHLAQDHRGIKERTRSMGSFKSVESATRFCRVPDEVRNFLRPRSYRNEVVSLAQRRLLYTARTRVLLTSLAAA